MKVTYGAIVQRASGRFGGTVHSNWKGIDVVRRFAKPSNPNSTSQQNVRNVFANLTRVYQMLPANMVAFWASYASGRKFIPRNAFIGQSANATVAAGNWTALSAYPGDSGAAPPSAGAATGGAGDIDIIITIPAPPTGWTLDRAWAWAIPANDPSVPLSLNECRSAYADGAGPSPVTVTITPLPAGTYSVYCGAKYFNPASDRAVSPSLYLSEEVVS